MNAKRVIATVGLALSGLGVWSADAGANETCQQGPVPVGQQLQCNMPFTGYIATASASSTRLVLSQNAGDGSPTFTTSIAFDEFGDVLGSLTITQPNESDSRDEIGIVTFDLQMVADDD
jgi:hypothetical protein